MNDFLQALYKERATLATRHWTISMFIEKQSEVISKTPYTEKDLTECEMRQGELEAAIKAVLNYRKLNKINLNHPNG